MHFLCIVNMGIHVHTRVCNGAGSKVSVCGLVVHCGRPEREMTTTKEAKEGRVAMFRWVYLQVCVAGATFCYASRAHAHAHIHAYTHARYNTTYGVCTWYCFAQTCPTRTLLAPAGRPIADANCTQALRFISTGLERHQDGRGSVLHKHCHR